MNVCAGIAQLVEHNLAKVGVASSSLVSRSKFRTNPDAVGVCRFRCGSPWLSAGKISVLRRLTHDAAGWQSGYAAACKAVYPGSIPGSASILDGVGRSRVLVDRCNTARVVELVDTRDLKSLALIGVPVRFRLRAPFQIMTDISFRKQN
jgi:hypothetical protein